MKLDATTGVLAVSNGQTNLLSGGAAARVAIDVGACRSDSCTGQTRLLSEGSINVSTEGGFQLRDNVSYGTRRLGLSMTAINLGDAASLQAMAAQAAAAGQYRAWHARTGDTEPVRARRNQCIRQRGPGHPQSGHRQQQPARAGAGGAGHPWLRQGR
ncbi:hypothetical protein G6F65_021885 [Rhizopus arrhizus]|nr:hypothetical protein G6F65_021885 [Rhizopus arrhizus]